MGFVIFAVPRSGPRAWYEDLVVAALQVAKTLDVMCYLAKGATSIIPSFGGSCVAKIAAFTPLAFAPTSFCTTVTSFHTNQLAPWANYAPKSQLHLGSQSGPAEHVEGCETLWWKRILRQGRRNVRSSSTLGPSRSFPSKYKNSKSTNMMRLFASCPERALRSTRRGSSKWALANSWFTARNTCKMTRSQWNKLLRLLRVSPINGQQSNGISQMKPRHVVREAIARENSSWCPIKPFWYKKEYRN